MSYFTQATVNQALAHFNRQFKDIKADTTGLAYSGGMVLPQSTYWTILADKARSEEDIKELAKVGGQSHPYVFGFNLSQFPTCCGCMEVSAFRINTPYTRSKSGDLLLRDPNKALDAVIRSMQLIQVLKDWAGYTQAIAIIMRDYQLMEGKALLAAGFKVINEFQNKRTGHHLQIFSGV